MTSSFDSKDFGNHKIFIDSTLNSVNDKVFITASSTTANNITWQPYTSSINLQPLPIENFARTRNKEKVIIILKHLGYAVSAVPDWLYTYTVIKPYRQYSVQMSFEALKEELLSIEPYVEFMLEPE
jgi:hypothetical protein